MNDTGHNEFQLLCFFKLYHTVQAAWYSDAMNSGEANFSGSALCLPDGMGGRERLVSKSKDSVCLSGYCCLALQSPLPWTLASVNRKSAMLFTQLCVSMPWDPRLPPLGHVWDVMLVWRKGNINKNCLCVTVVCTIIMVHKDMSSSYRSVDCIRLWSCLVQLSVFQAPLCL